MGSFFMRYMMQVAFLINMLYLFDIPHFFVKTIRKLIHKYKYRHFPDKNIQAFKDTWFFDLGYFQAYGLTLFFLGLLFAVVIPLITIFSCIFFSLRYFFDKYHQTFVYFKEFEAKGRLK
jgi:Calcium-dependent channel, 7TM region, putative phosphate